MRWMAIPLAAAAILSGAACRRDDRPNVLLVTLDTTRADALGAMGNAAARTPTLDALAARGVLFERAYASVPLTLPSHATLHTGLDPQLHGVLDNVGFALPQELETLAGRLSAGGYATAAFVAAAVLNARFGLDRGFDVYDDEVSPQGDPLSQMVPQRRGEEVTERALAWLGERRRAPFFLWAHYYDPHAPRDAPPPFDQIPDPYAAEVAYADAQVARLLAGAERAARGRETLILVVGDHGESLGQHGEPTHGIVAYDSTLHVPLIAAGPGFAPGGRSRSFVSTSDVAPTLLAAVGEPPFARSQGVPLQRAQHGGGPDGRVLYFASLGPWYRFGWARLSGVRTSRWKYTAEPEPVELYDVWADPGETTNRAESEPEVGARLAALHAERRAAERAAEGAAKPASPEIAEKLVALGYVTAPQQFEPGQEPDPRRFVEALGWIEASRALAAEGRVADSILALRGLATSRFVRVLALRSLASVYLAAGRTAEAVATYEELVSLSPAPELRRELAEALLRDGRPEECLQLVEGLSAGSEPRPRLLLLRAAALLDLGRAGEAVDAATALLRREPDDDDALALLSRARAARDGAAPEIERLAALLDSSPEAGRLPQTRAVLAALLRAEGRAAEAVRLLEAAAEPPPEYLAMLAEIAMEHGNLPKAAEFYERALAARPAAEAFRLELADLYDRLERFEEALALYDELVSVAPGDAALYVDRGVTRFHAQRLGDAEADFRQALSLDEDLPEARLNLALIELRTEREAEAERNLLRAVELRPDYAKAHYHLASLYRRRGDPRAAKHAELAAGGSPELFPAQ